MLKKQCNLLLSFIFLMIIVNPIYASAGSHLVSLLNKMHSMTGQFEQFTLQNHQKMITKGDFALQRPNKFYWNITVPDQELLVSNGQTLWYYQPSLVQVTVSNVHKRISPTPLQVLGGNSNKLLEAYAITEPTPNHFVLVSKKPESFSKLTLVFNNERLVSLQFVDQLQQKNTIVFSHIRFNPTIAVSQFTFTIPKGVDVIH